MSGRRLAVLVESSRELAQVNEGRRFKEYKEALKLLVEEQLVDKETVYFVQFGNCAAPRNPEPVKFELCRSQCVGYANQWIGDLKGEGGCNLLAAVKVALSLQRQVDTICVVLCTK